jgi:hypothetical protein
MRKYLNDELIKSTMQTGLGLSNLTVHQTAWQSHKAECPPRMNGTKLVILEIHRHNIVPVPISGHFLTDFDCIPPRYFTLALQPKDKEISAHQQHKVKQINHHKVQDTHRSPFLMMQQGIEHGDIESHTF